MTKSARVKPFQGEWLITGRIPPAWSTSIISCIKKKQIFVKRWHLAYIQRVYSIGKKKKRGGHMPRVDPCQWQTGHTPCINREWHYNSKKKHDQSTRNAVRDFCAFNLHITQFRHTVHTNIMPNTLSDFHF